MTKPKSADTALDRLADLLVDDILNASDEEIRDEAPDSSLSRAALQQALEITVRTIDDGALSQASADVRALLTPTGPLLTTDRIAMLFGEPRVRGYFDAAREALVAMGRAIAIPRLAAAATSDPVMQRTFPGGVVELRSSAARPEQTWLLITLTDNLPPPSRIIVTHDGEGAVKVVEGAAVFGLVQILLDNGDANDAALLRLLRDPTSDVTLVLSERKLSSACDLE